MRVSELLVNACNCCKRLCGQIRFVAMCDQGIDPHAHLCSTPATVALPRPTKSARSVSSQRSAVMASSITVTGEERLP